MATSPDEQLKLIINTDDIVWGSLEAMENQDVLMNLSLMKETTSRQIKGNMGCWTARYNV